MVKILKNEGARSTKNIPDASIPPSTVFTGDIDTAGGIRIDGTVKGKVSAGGDVTIGLEGTVEGGIKASNVNVAGKIMGNVTVSGAVQMLKGSKLAGDLAASSFAIEEGAYYKGQCIISGSQEPPMLSAPKESSEPDMEDEEPKKSSAEADESDAAESKKNSSKSDESQAEKTEEAEAQENDSQADESATAESESNESEDDEAAESHNEKESQKNNNTAKNNRRKNRKR